MSETADYGIYREWMPGDFKGEVADILGGAVTLRRGDDRGGFDELVASGVDVHFEMMGDGQMYVGIRAPNSGDSFTMYITVSHRKLSINASEDASSIRSPHTTADRSKL